MDISVTKAVERVARVLAAQRISSNSGGSDSHAADEVDAAWRDHCNDAVAILKALREPDEQMERAGDIAIWQRMIGAALGDGANGPELSNAAPEPGTDPFHEGP